MVVERLVEDRFLHAGLAGDLTERTTRRGGLLHDLRRLVVADVGIERGRGREGQLQSPVKREGPPRGGPSLVIRAETYLMNT